jgi:3',5'-cyclic AMP phosphodiesterase CpdA
MLKKSVFSIVLILMIIINTSTLAAGIQKSAPECVRLSWTGDTMTVTWHAGITAGGGAMRYGTNRLLTDVGEINAVEIVAASGGDLDFRIFRATPTSLKPATTYYYSVGNDDNWSPVYSFTTAERDTGSVSFLYMGDIQAVDSDIDTWGRMLTDAYAKNPGLSFGMFGGDLVDNGTRADQWRPLLKNASPVFSKIPLMPANGNHESNFPSGKPELYLDLFALPRNGPEGFKEEFYSYDYGNCHIVVLNSWVFSGEQKVDADDYEKINRWIAGDLGASHAAWKIVVMHHPVYSLASDRVADAVRKNWEPLLESGGVSLVLCGHQHVYARSFPMTDGKIDEENGIAYIMGNAGGKFYETADETYQAKTLYDVSTYQIIRTDGSSLTVQTFDDKGNELDCCALSPRTGTGFAAAVSDVDDSAWYAGAAAYTTGRGLMDGMGNNEFAPDLPLTRAMISQVIFRLSERADDISETRKAQPAVFSDVSVGAWYADAVAWITSEGIAEGYGDGRFGPDDVITREQFISLLYRYAALQSSDLSAEADLSFYSDMSSVSVWAADDVRWAVRSGLIGGLPGGLLAPRDTMTRAQCAEILRRFCLECAY